MFNQSNAQWFVASPHYKEEKDDMYMSHLFVELFLSLFLFCSYQRLNNP